MSDTIKEEFARAGEASPITPQLLEQDGYRKNHRRLRHRRAAGIIVSIAFFGCFLPENLVNWNIFITFAA